MVWFGLYRRGDQTDGGQIGPYEVACWVIKSTKTEMREKQNFGQTLDFASGNDGEYQNFYKQLFEIILGGRMRWELQVCHACIFRSQCEAGQNWIIDAGWITFPRKAVSSYRPDFENRQLYIVHGRPV